MEVLLDPLEIVEGHSKTEGLIELYELILSHVLEAIKDLNILGLIKIINKSLRLSFICDSGINRVHGVILDLLKLLISNITDKHICNCCADHRLLVALDETHALNSRVSSLVKLSGKCFNAEYFCSFRDLDFFVIKDINRRL